MSYNYEETATRTWDTATLLSPLRIVYIAYVFYLITFPVLSSLNIYKKKIFLKNCSIFVFFC